MKMVNLFDYEPSETIEEDAEKLTLYEFTASVLFFYIISSGNNGNDAKSLVWGLQELLAE